MFSNVHYFYLIICDFAASFVCFFFSSGSLLAFMYECSQGTRGLCTANVIAQPPIQTYFFFFATLSLFMFFSKFNAFINLIFIITKNNILPYHAHSYFFSHFHKTLLAQITQCAAMILYYISKIANVLMQIFSHCFLTTFSKCAIVTQL